MSKELVFSKKNIVFMGILAVLAGISAFLLKTDFSPFIRWYLFAAIFGIGFFPLSAALFSSFSDKGWLFSKATGILIGGYVLWALALGGKVRFTGGNALLILFIAAAVLWVLLRKKTVSEVPSVTLILQEEVLFLAVFLFWTYVSGFRPEALSTEKFMDYGFLAVLYGSETLPAKDI